MLSPLKTTHIRTTLRTAAPPQAFLATEQSACSAVAVYLRMRKKRVCPPDKDGGQMRNHDDVSEFSPNLRKRRRS